MTPLARFDHVTRRFDDIVAVDDVTLQIAPGTLVGLLGPNGAGKTTLLSLLQGLRRPSSGRVELFGGDPADAARAPAARLHSAGDGAARDPPRRRGGRLRRRALRRPRPHGRARGGVRLRRAAAPPDWIAVGRPEAPGLGRAGVRRQRPRLVLLDEPTTGLDVDARRALWEAIRRQHASGATVVVTSHYLEEIEALAERVIVMGEGRVLADDDLPKVLARVGLSRVAAAKQLSRSRSPPSRVSSDANATDERRAAHGRGCRRVHPVPRDLRRRLPRPDRARRHPRGGLPLPDRFHACPRGGSHDRCRGIRRHSIRRSALTLLHAKYGLIETFRVPIAVIGTLVFPALALLFFVVPQRAVADNPLYRDRRRSSRCPCSPS